MGVPQEMISALDHSDALQAYGIRITVWSRVSAGPESGFDKLPKGYDISRRLRKQALVIPKSVVIIIISYK